MNSDFNVCISLTPNEESAPCYVKIGKNKKSLLPEGKMPFWNMMHMSHAKSHWVLKFDTLQSCMNTAVILSLDFMGLDSTNHFFPALYIFSLSVCSNKT